nr:SOS response-associated peptidase family protein [Parazoarcus communis]
MYEPCYESGKTFRWRIARRDGRPMGVAGIWTRREEAGELSERSMSMLTINADGDPVMQRFHKPEDEMRSVVILPEDSWRNWLGAKSEQEARKLLQRYPADGLSVTEATR